MEKAPLLVCVCVCVGGGAAGWSCAAAAPLGKAHYCDAELGRRTHLPRPASMRTCTWPPHSEITRPFRAARPPTPFPNHTHNDNNKKYRLGAHSHCYHCLDPIPPTEGGENK